MLSRSSLVATVTMDWQGGDRGGVSWIGGRDRESDVLSRQILDSAFPDVEEGLPPFFFYISFIFEKNLLIIY